ncbi:MAG: hypothetical protein ABSD74_00690 [Rhizomicrobium sp.]|jgi:hypothetical protein
MRAGDLCQLAAELVSEHGDEALHFARRATAEYASEGVQDRALFWYALSLFLDDIVAHRLDPDTPIVLH